MIVKEQCGNRASYIVHAKRMNRFGRVQMEKDYPVCHRHFISRWQGHENLRKPNDQKTNVRVTRTSVNPLERDYNCTQLVAVEKNDDRIAD